MKLKGPKGELITVPDGMEEQAFEAQANGTLAQFAESLQERSINKKGGMLKRKDGSYSRRGLWDNIRAKAAANRRSGKKGKRPTAEMLRQESRIRAKAKDGIVVGEETPAVDLTQVPQGYFLNPAAYDYKTKPKVFVAPAPTKEERLANIGRNAAKGTAEQDYTLESLFMPTPGIGRTLKAVSKLGSKKAATSVPKTLVKESGMDEVLQKLTGNKNAKLSKEPLIKFNDSEVIAHIPGLENPKLQYSPETFDLSLDALGDKGLIGGSTGIKGGVTDVPSFNRQLNDFRRSMVHGNYPIESNAKGPFITSTPKKLDTPNITFINPSNLAERGALQFRGPSLFYNNKMNEVPKMSDLYKEAVKFPGSEVREILPVDAMDLYRTYYVPNKQGGAVTTWKSGPKSMAEAEAMIADGRLKVSAPNNDGAKALKYMVDAAGMVYYPASLLGAAWDLTQGDINGAVAGAIPFGTGLQAIRAAGQLGKAAGGGRKAIRAANNLGLMHVGSQAKDTYDDVVTPLRTTKAAGGTVFKGYVTEQPMGDAVPFHTSTIGEKMGKGGYTVKRSSARKGKTHVVIGPDGTKKYFGDSKLGQHPKDAKRKKSFYARHAKNLKGNPYFRAFARATWADGGKLGLSKNMYEEIGVMPYRYGGSTINPYTGLIEVPEGYGEMAYNERDRDLYRKGGFLSKAGAFFADAGKAVGDTVMSSVGAVTGIDALKDVIKDQHYKTAAFDKASNVAGGLGDVISTAAKFVPGVNLIAGAAGGVGSLVDRVAKIDQRFYNPSEHQSKFEKATAGIRQIGDIASMFVGNPSGLLGKGLQLGAKTSNVVSGIGKVASLGNMAYGIGDSFKSGNVNPMQLLQLGLGANSIAKGGFFSGTNASGTNNVNPNAGASTAGMGGGSPYGNFMSGVDANLATQFPSIYGKKYGGYTHMADGGVNLTSQPVVGAFGNTPKYSQTIAPTEVLGSENSREYSENSKDYIGESLSDEDYIPAIVGYNPETFTDPKIQDYFYRRYPARHIYEAPTEYDSKGNPVIYKNYFIDHKTGKRQDGHGYMYSPHKFIGRYNDYVGFEKATREECPECYDEAFKEGKVGAPENYMMPNGINYNYQDLIKAYPSMRDPRVFKKAFNKDAPKMADGGQTGLVPINVEGADFSEGSGPDARKGELLVLNGKIYKNYVGRPPHPAQGQNPLGNDEALEGLIVIPKNRTKEYLEAGLTKRKQMERSLVSQQQDREMKKSRKMGDGGYYSFGMGEMGMGEGGDIITPNGNPENIESMMGYGYKKGGWIQKATKSIKRRGTEGVCTGSKFGSSSCPPGSRRYNLAKTFRKMAKARKHEHGGFVDPVTGSHTIMYGQGGQLPEDLLRARMEASGATPEQIDTYIAERNSHAMGGNVNPNYSYGRAIVNRGRFKEGGPTIHDFPIRRLRYDVNRVVTLPPYTDEYVPEVITPRQQAIMDYVNSGKYIGTNYDDSNLSDAGAPLRYANPFTAAEPSINAPSVINPNRSQQNYANYVTSGQAILGGPNTQYTNNLLPFGPIANPNPFTAAQPAAPGIQPTPAQAAMMRRINAGEPITNTTYKPTYQIPTIELDLNAAGSTPYMDEGMNAQGEYYDQSTGTARSASDSNLARQARTQNINRAAALQDLAGLAPTLYNLGRYAFEKPDLMKYDEYMTPAMKFRATRFDETPFREATSRALYNSNMGLAARTALASGMAQGRSAGYMDWLNREALRRQGVDEANLGIDARNKAMKYQIALQNMQAKARRKDFLGTATEQLAQTFGRDPRYFAAIAGDKSAYRTPFSGWYDTDANTTTNTTTTNSSGSSDGGSFDAASRRYMAGVDRDLEAQFPTIYKRGR